MKYQTTLRWLIPLLAVLALVAAAAGVFWQTAGQPYAFTSMRGETVSLLGHGLYRFDTVSMAAQEQGADVVTLVVGLPLLAVSTWLAFGGSLRGRLLLTGTLGYFLYNYLSMAFLSAYNPLFLVYVALFALGLTGFILSMLSFDLPDLRRHFSARLPRRAIAGVLFTTGGFLLLAWLGRIVPGLLQSTTPPLENTTTLVIQAMDLGLLVPLAFLSGVLLLRGSPWGYLLASVAVLKMLTLGAAVSAMGLSMALSSVPDSAAILVIFLMLTLAHLVMAVLLLSNVDAPPPAPRLAARLP